MTDALGLDGKPALVVGGGFGIGRAAALLLAQLGARVAVADLDGDRAAAVAKEVDGVAVTGDVTDEQGAAAVVDEAHDRLGGLEGVINIVGIASWGDIYSLDAATWDSQFRMNLLHHLYVGRAAARHMMEERGGALALVTSVSGIYGAPNHAAYGAAKAGANSLVRSMAVEWSGRGVRVNAVAPDIIATPRLLGDDPEAHLAAMNDTAARDGVPMARFGQPEEIAGPLVFLLSGLSSFMTGQCLVVDGGTQVAFPHGAGLASLSEPT